MVEIGSLLGGRYRLLELLDAPTREHHVVAVAQKFLRNGFADPGTGSGDDGGLGGQVMVQIVSVPDFRVDSTLNISGTFPPETLQTVTD